MSILEIKGLTHRYDDRLLFNNAELTISAGEHVGIVGLNGAGKSTFINIISQKLPQDEGEIKWLSGVRRGYLDQHADVDRTLTVDEYLKGAFSHLFEINEKLEKIYSDMANASGGELDALIKRSARLQEILNNENFYDLDSRIKKVANGLGVNKFGYSTVIGRLSGGERVKLMLSRLLLEEPDVMLLDEPTNFLDVEHVDWLEKYLNGYKKTFLVISHDTAFLNGVCKTIVSIENGEIFKYGGNYDRYKELSAMRSKQYEESYRRQISEIKRLQEYIDRNKARASTAGMANSRKKMLDRMNVMQKPTAVGEVRFDFICEELNAKEFLTVNNLEIGYAEPLIPPVGLKMTSRSKVWIRGTNGVGKTTLLKTLMHQIKPLGGSFQFHLEAKPLYLEQEVGFDNPEQSAAQYFASRFPRLGAKEQRAALAAVGIKGELAVKPLKSLSGGEQVKVRLAVLCRQPSNVLILDEPTNHLDAVAKKALKKAVSEYRGAVILVCHEAEFAEGVCDVVFDAKPRRG